MIKITCDLCKNELKNAEELLLLREFETDNIKEVCTPCNDKLLKYYRNLEYEHRELMKEQLKNYIREIKILNGKH